MCHLRCGHSVMHEVGRFPAIIPKSRRGHEATLRSNRHHSENISRSAREAARLKIKRSLRKRSFTHRSCLFSLVNSTDSFMRLSTSSFALQFEKENFNKSWKGVKVYGCIRSALCRCISYNTVAHFFVLSGICYHWHQNLKGSGTQDATL